MRTTTLAIGILLALAVTGVIATIPGTEEISAVHAAQAKPCVIGSDGSCIIPIYCFTDPCPHIP